MNRLPKMCLLIWSVLLFGLLTEPMASANTDKPNIDVILIDDQGRLKASPLFCKPGPDAKTKNGPRKRAEEEE